MIAERPFLGFGPASFVAAYPRFASAAEVDPLGRSQALEDPHNVVLALAVSCGVPTAIALVVAGGAFLTLAWRQSGSAAWAAGGVAALATALQVHMTTLAPAAVGAVLLGALLGAGDGVASRDARAPRAWWPAACGALFSAGVIAAVALNAADARVGWGFAAAERAEWAAARSVFASARRLAPWEPAIVWARGRAATDAIPRVASAANDGALALEDAARRMPQDSRPLRDLGDLYIASAVAGSDEAWTLALEAYGRALALAPTDPTAWLGRGVAEAGAGDLPSALRDITHATVLAPRFVAAWENLAAVYDALGDPIAAAQARARAAAAQ